jgi:hypothetical protein
MGEPGYHVKVITEGSHFGGANDEVAGFAVRCRPGRHTLRRLEEFFRRALALSNDEVRRYRSAEVDPRQRRVVREALEGEHDERARDGPGSRAGPESSFRRMAIVALAVVG